MKKYFSFFRIRFANTLQYRAAAAAGVATQFAWGFLELLLFRAFYESNPAAFPMEYSQLASYIWLQQALLAMVMVWFLDGEIFKSIVSGDVAYELVRPADLYTMWFTKNMAVRLSRALLRALPILIVAVLLPPPYRLTAPASFMAFILFVITLVFAFFVVIAYCMLTYIITFYTMNPMGIRLIGSVLADIFSGSVIPLPFMPEPVLRVINLTPFAVMQNITFRIYSGNIAGDEIWRMMGLQIFWGIVLAGGGYQMMRHALRRVVVQGG